MKTSRIISTITLALFILVLTSCTKDEGFEGKAAIKGTTTYSGGVADGALVSIAFGETEATDAVDYTTVSDASGNYRFEALSTGDYYVTASYMDENGHVFQTGGAHVEIGERKGEVTVDLTLE